MEATACRSDCGLYPCLVLENVFPAKSRGHVTVSLVKVATPRDAIGVICLRTKTDCRQKALNDVFAMVSCVIHQVMLVHRPIGDLSGPAAIR